MTASALSLDGRLLAACNEAASISCAPSDAPFKLGRSPHTVWPALVGWTEPPHTFTAGPDAINACLIGRIPEGILITFRGSLNPWDATKSADARLLDWLNDFRGELVEGEINGIQIPGLVHDGFYNALRSLFDDVEAELIRIARPNDKIHIVGHSKGGAVAILASLVLHSAANPVSLVVTFAAPRAGNDVMASTFGMSGIPCRRFEAGVDLVPHLPPTSRFAEFLTSHIGGVHGALNFESVGDLSYCDYRGEVVRPISGSPRDHLLAAQRDVRMMSAIWCFEESAMLADHSIAVGSKFQRAIAPGAAGEAA